MNWLYQAIGLQQVKIFTRSRGNNLYVLCEGRVCPSQPIVMLRLVRALAKTKVQCLMPEGQPQVYQVVLYGRSLGQPRPQWAEVIDLNQIDRHLEKLQRRAATSGSGEPGAEKPSDSRRLGGPDGAIVLANIALAKQGKSEAIARYLSEALSTLGVSVKASVRSVVRAEADPMPLLNRLWVVCESIYSPDPSLVAAAIPQKLRDLELTGFRDAIVLGQVRGESKPDWSLRVDLTPPDEMLREWARWGDVEALTRLLNRTLAEQTVQVSATLKQTTLHITCQPGEWEPQKHRVMEAIAPLLETIAPQGIHAVTVYGGAVATDRGEAETNRVWVNSIRSVAPLATSQPAWVEWLDLPAKVHSALADSTETLAKQGDLPAITYLLTRLLNLDLDRQLATGGTQIQVRRKQDLLHIMADATLCPSQGTVGTRSPSCSSLWQLRR
ncbi:MAG: hypothetical protein HC936_03240 [Leptolyngbyaceae cyanobacterium SU_3_3]|nr:hypothetical protein [Leptolyngbyaceae cyanobacterium SU_3_3]